jgi:hypothetical protein
MIRKPFLQKVLFVRQRYLFSLGTAPHISRRRAVFYRVKKHILINRAFQPLPFMAGRKTQPQYTTPLPGLQELHSLFTK